MRKLTWKLGRLFRRVTPRSFRRFARAESGVTAIEFAIVATPFFGLLFAILETALVFFGQQTLETAVSNAGREIRTGQAQQQGFSQAAFKAEVCDEVSALLDCAKLSLDVRTFATFDSLNTTDFTTPKDKNGNLDTSSFEYQPGHGTDIVLVRAFYEWPTFSQLLGLDLDNMADGSHLLAAAAAFRNEPFPW